MAIEDDPLSARLEEKLRDLPVTVEDAPTLEQMTWPTQPLPITRPQPYPQWVSPGPHGPVRPPPQPQPPPPQQRCPTCAGPIPPFRIAPSRPPIPLGPPKSRVVAALLAFFFGIAGVHRFYVGHSGLGMVYVALLFVGCFTFGLTWLAAAVWAFIDFVLILTGDLRDSSGRLLV